MRSRLRRWRGPYASSPKGPKYPTPTPSSSDGRSAGERLRRRRGPRDRVALCEVDAQLPQRRERLVALDALGDRFLPEPVRKARDGPDDVAARLVGEQVAHELRVDLEELDRQALEVGEA